MPERIAGKIFKTPEEVGQPFTPEQLADIQRQFDEFNALRDAVPESEQIHLPERFGDDLIGTEYEDQYRAQVEGRKARGEFWDQQG
ncbi:hypothetical protein [Nocardia sp. NPDC050710]|uniref:hypothetical protein n=1 Tax=Nocardia sp. NPDC050710 TaxID=3157220 RepID=UPI0033D53F08